jgi:hypothetical protein
MLMLGAYQGPHDVAKEIRAPDDVKETDAAAATTFSRARIGDSHRCGESTKGYQR